MADMAAVADVAVVVVIMVAFINVVADQGMAVAAAVVFRQLLLV
jgi:hypothetical protein